MKGDCSWVVKPGNAQEDFARVGLQKRMGAQTGVRVFRLFDNAAPFTAYTDVTRVRKQVHHECWMLVDMKELCVTSTSSTCTSCLKCCLHLVTFGGGGGAARSSAVRWSAMLQIGRSRVRVPMRSLVFFSIYQILPAALWPWDLLTNRRSFWGIERGRRVRLTTLPPSERWLSRQCRISNILQPYRPPRSVTGTSLLPFTHFEQPALQQESFVCSL
jgi:hypothetical protein